MPRKAQSKSSGPLQQPISPVYVISGKERRRAVDELGKIVDFLLEDSDPQVCLSQYDGPDAKLADVLDDLRTLPFLAERRVIVVKDADKFITNYREYLENYLNAPSATGVLVMLADSFPKTTRLAKLVAKIGQHIPCDPVKANQLPEFIADYARSQYNLALNVNAARLLVELVGDDSGMLESEIDKVATYLAGSTEKNISAELIQNLIGDNRQFNAFNVIDAMTEGNTALALTRFNQMIQRSKDAQFTAVGAFAWHFRRLYNARLLLDERVSERDIISRVKLWGNVRQFMTQVHRLNIRQIAAVIRELTKIDLDSKTGRGTVASGLEKLIVKFGRTARQTG